jgi:uncharacterized protein
MRVVIDTNVWISLTVFGGLPLRCFESVLRDGHELIICSELVEEYRKVILRSFPEFKEKSEIFLALTIVEAKLFEISDKSIAVSRDPNDDYLLNLSKVSRANLLITGDKDLLVLNSYGMTKIVTPSQAFNLLI